jgi:hypothetical protein
MSTTVMSNRWELNSVAHTTLEASAGLWLVIAVGPWAFVPHIFFSHVLLPLISTILWVIRDWFTNIKPRTLDSATRMKEERV